MDDLDDLVTGQLSPLAAWRLRRRIARDPELRQEWMRTQQLQTELRYLTQSGRAWVAARRSVVSSVPTFTLGGITMKRRTVFAACAVCLFSITGVAVATRKWQYTGPEISAQDAARRTWDVRTPMEGHIRLLDQKGGLLGEIDSNGIYPASDLIEVTCDQDVHLFLHGYGRHEVRSETGTLLGYVDASPRTEEDKRRERDAMVKQLPRSIAMYRSPEVFYPFEGQLVLPRDGTADLGMAAAYYRQPGVAWKMIGYGRVIANCPLDARPRMQYSAAASAPSPAELPAPLRKQAETMRDYIPASDGIPRIYWQMAAGADRTIVDGHWNNIAHSGSFTGYGHHEVRDARGKLILSLDVQPLTP